MGRGRVKWVLAIAAVSCGAFAAQAQIIFDNHPRAGEVNFSGATLFRPFFFSPATTNDAIDVNQDGFKGFDPNTPPFVQQLARDYNGGGSLSTFWAVSYRSVGSINGFGEFVTYQLCNQFSGSVPSEDGFLNRFPWASGGRKLNGPGADCLDPNGFRIPDGDPNNDDGSPFCRGSVDGAAIDVPGAWAVKGPRDDNNRRWYRNPTEPGYGDNPILSNTGWKSELQSLSRGCTQISLNTNTQNPDQNTIYDTTVAWGPIVYIANRGVARPDLNQDGIEGDIRMTDIQHLFVTGRTRHGENLAAATRSTGSGTRNGIQNTSGYDPAWGRGDNLDNEWAVTTDAHLGLNRRITNAEGSSGVERAVQVSRLAIGFTGLAGNERAAFDANAGRYEILNLRFDDRAPVSTNAFVRPTVNSVVDNADPNTGWQCGGTVTFVTRGDPFENDPNKPQYLESVPTIWYIRNIVESARQFTGEPNRPENLNMPGEYLATTFFLTAGIDALPVVTDPTNFVPNPDLNQVLQDYIRAKNGLGIGGDTPAYGSKNPAGQVPTRKDAPRDPNDPNRIIFYLDGQIRDYAYVDPNGVPQPPIAGGRKLAARNRVQGDFNRDAQRDIRDIPKLIEAVANPLAFEVGLPTWPPNGQIGDQTVNTVIVHVIGDFNGDGNCDKADVRYFADGLALDPNLPGLDPNDPGVAQYGFWLNRPQAFLDVDMASFALEGANNYFGTTLATNKTYEMGDSRGDIAGSAAGEAAGADPRGADGKINAKDIDRVYWAFRNQYLGFDNDQVDWRDLDQAVYSDLSADMNGPQVVNGVRTILINDEDVCVLVQDILGTDYGDVNLDGVVDTADENIVKANQGRTGLGWAGGDLNGDNIVDAKDLLYFKKADLNCDGEVNFADINAFVTALSGREAYHAAYCCNWFNADVNCDGDVNFADINPFVTCLGGGNCECP